MAERNIGLRLQLNGANLAIKSVKDLEKELKLAKEDLKELEIGSSLFKELSGEISNAESQLKKLNNSSKGLNFDKQLQGVAKFAGGVTSSFAAATAAVQLFGGETEDISKAAAQAQNLLTVAIGARSVEEVILGARIIATTIAQRAQTAATLATNTAMKALFATIAANPMGALLTVIGLVVGALVALNSTTQKSITLEDEFNKKLKEGQKPLLDRQISLKSLQTIINDNTQSENTRLQALNDLKKILPELKNLTLDNKDATDLINQAIERNIRLIALQVQAEAGKELAIEKAKLAQEALNETLEQQTNLFEEILLADNPLALAKLRQDRLTEKQTRTQKEANQAEQLYINILNKSLPLQREQNKITEDADKAEKEAQERKKARIFLLESEIKLIEENIKLRQELVKVLAATAPEPEIIKRLTNELNKITSSIQTTQSEFQKLFDADFREQFNKNFKNLIKTTEEESDVFGDVFLLLRKRISTAILKQSNDFKENIEESYNALLVLFQSGEITKEALVAGQQVLTNYKVIQNEIEKQPKLFQDNLDIELFFDYIKDFKIASGEIINDFDTTTGEITQSQLKVGKSFVEAQNNYENYVQSLINQNAEALKSDKTFVDRLTLGRQQIISTETNLEIRQQKLREFEKQVEKERIQEATNRVQNVINLSNEIIKTEQQIINFSKEASDIRAEIIENETAFIQSLFVNQSNEIIKSAGIELQKRKGFIATLKKEVEDFNTFREREEKRLLKEFPQLEKLSTEERLKVLEAYYLKLKELRDKNTEEEKQSAAQISQSISETVRNLTNTLQLGVEVIATSIQLQQDRVNQFEERALAQVVGNSEEAEKKKLEIQQIYEAQRKQLTKQGQIAQLQITRAQALANVAEAVTKALAAGPIIGQILAGVSAGLGLVQVGVVTSQIQQVRSLQSGGLVKGPSHSQGGVSFARGGVELEGNEAVINRRSTLNYGGLLDAINQSGGGRPIRVESAMDSRMMEVIAGQKTQPIRAYVLEQDITKSQTINRRLEELASF